jgi:transcriptional regulator NrdR family protein
MALPCPYCHCKMTSVRNTISIKFHGKEYVRRYRICRHCKMSFATREEVVEESVAHPPPKNQNGVPPNPFI